MNKIPLIVEIIGILMVSTGIGIEWITRTPIGFIIINIGCVIVAIGGLIYAKIYRRK